MLDGGLRLLGTVDDSVTRGSTATTPSLGAVLVKAAASHTLTYFVVGVSSFFVLDYAAAFVAPETAGYLRPTTDALVMAGPIFQPVRGALLGSALWLVRDAVFAAPRGWLRIWAILLVVGVVSPFGAMPGSIEGLVYTTWPVSAHLRLLPELVVQTGLLSWLLHSWVVRPDRRWMTWTVGGGAVVVVALAVAGLAASAAR